MIAIDPPVRILIFSLASEGPSTHALERSRSTGKIKQFVQPIGEPRDDPIG
jgi:hypothetical protein